MRIGKTPLWITHVWKYGCGKQGNEKSQRNLQQNCDFSSNIFIVVELTITEFVLGSAIHCRQKEALKRTKMQ